MVFFNSLFSPQVVVLLGSLLLRHVLHALPVGEFLLRRCRVKCRVLPKTQRSEWKQTQTFRADVWKTPLLKRDTANKDRNKRPEFVKPAESRFHSHADLWPLRASAGTGRSSFREIILKTINKGKDSSSEKI